MSAMSMNGESGRYFYLNWIVYDSMLSTLSEFHDSFTDSPVTSVVMTPVGGSGNTEVRIEHGQH